MTFWGIWGHFEDQLRTWGLRTLGTFCAFSWLFEDFADLLRDLRTILELLMSSCGPFEGPQDFDDVDNLLGTLMSTGIPFVTSEDFEGFDDLLRNLRTFWGSVENLRSEDLGYLLCIFLTFWGLSGPFEEFWKTWGPDFLRTLKNLSGTFDDFLWTYWGPDAFEDFNDFSGHWGFCEPDYLLRTLRTLINFWGLWIWTLRGLW